MPRLLAALALTLLVLASCSKPGPARPLAPLPEPGTGPDPTPAAATISDDELDALMRETVAYLGQVAAAVQGAGTDCPAMAAGIERVVDDHAALLERARTLDDPSVEDRSEKWLDAHAAEVKPMFETLFEALEPCGQDPAVQAAVEKMGGA